LSTGIGSLARKRRRLIDAYHESGTYFAPDPLFERGGGLFAVLSAGQHAPERGRSWTKNDARGPGDSFRVAWIRSLRADG